MRPAPSASPANVSGTVDAPAVPQQQRLRYDPGQSRRDLRRDLLRGLCLLKMVFGHLWHTPLHVIQGLTLERSVTTLPGRDPGFVRLRWRAEPHQHRATIDLTHLLPDTGGGESRP